MMNRRLFVGSLTALCLLPITDAFSSPRTKGRTISIPEGYIRVANQKGVPALILYGVALQESTMLFGSKQNRHSLPWPWTLNVKGTPRRFESRLLAERALAENIDVGITLVDIGLMQVNWYWHKDRFDSFKNALDPYTNLRVSADILLEQFAQTKNWYQAVGRYHSQKNIQRANAYASSVFQRLGISANA